MARKLLSDTMLIRWTSLGKISQDFTLEAFTLGYIRAAGTLVPAAFFEVFRYKLVHNCVNRNDSTNRSVEVTRRE